MELSKVKPSKIYDKNEVTFKDLLKQILKTRFNGFIRITTSNTNEGFILFKDGKGIAASHSRYLKNNVLDEELYKEDALRKIEHGTKNRSFIIEVYELTLSQIDYAMEFNEKYVLDDDYLSRYLKKSSKTIKKGKSDGNNFYRIYGKDKRKIRSKKELIAELNENDNHLSGKNIPDKKIIKKHNEEHFDIRQLSYIYDPDYSRDSPSDEIGNMNETDQITEALIIEKPQQTKAQSKDIKSLIAAIKGSQQKNNGTPGNITPGNMNRIEKSTKTYSDHRNMEELKLLLYSLNSHEIEMIELNIMNNIKKAMLYIPKIKEKSVNISIDRKNDLMGRVNIVAEYTDKGFLDFVTGSFKDDMHYLEDRIYESTQVEIKNVFGNFHEVLDYFDISIKVV